MIDRVLARREEFSNVELAATLGVDESYVRKLRGGWRPSRAREDLWARLAALDPEPRGRAAGAGQPDFYNGVLFAAQAMSETLTRLLAEARAGLSPGGTPTAGEIADGLAALEAEDRRRAQGGGGEGPTVRDQPA